MKKLTFFYIFLLPFILVGCALLPEEPPALAPPRPFIVQEHTFNTASVTRGDILIGTNPFAIYMPARVVNISFSAGGIPIEGIFVSVGDEVSEGDIIAALYIPEIQHENDELVARHEELSFELGLLNQRLALARRLAEASGEILDEASFIASRNSLMAEFELVDNLLEHVAYLNDARYLRSTADGLITHVVPFSEGMIANTRVPIATISNQAFSAFVVQGPSAELMNPGDRFEMILVSEIYLMEVIDPDDFDFIRAARPASDGDEVIPEAFLVFVDLPPEHGVVTQGRIIMPLQEIHDVLHIPSRALHRFEERAFVYVLEDGLRTIRDVVAGIEGNEHVEIISGLEEGELVIQ